jgi:hypothetical protein
MNKIESSFGKLRAVLSYLLVCSFTALLVVLLSFKGGLVYAEETPRISIDCTDRSSWKVDLLPHQSKVEIVMGNCYCFSSSDEAKKGLRQTAFEVIKNIEKMKKEGVPFDQYEHIKDHYQRVAKMSVGLGKTKYHDEYCYTVDQVKSYLEKSLP